MWKNSQKEGREKTGKKKLKKKWIETERDKIMHGGCVALSRVSPSESHACTV